MTDASAHSYRPGPWFAVVGEHATVLLPPAEKERVAELWSVVDDGGGFDVVLDALISRGLRDLTGFVLVATAEGTTRLVVRGPAQAHVVADDGEVTVDGTEATTWAERTLSGVSSLRLVVADAAEEAALHTMTGGLVRVSELTTPAEVGGHQHEDEVEVPADEPDPDPGAELPTTGPMPVPEAPPGPLGPETDWSQPPPEPPIGVPSGPPPPVAVTQPVPLQSSVPGPEESEPAAVVRLVFSHGEEVAVDRAVVVGRAPQAGRSRGTGEPQLVTVPSPGQEISSTHLEVRPGSGSDHGHAVVEDLGSTNGTVLVRPGQAAEELTAGTPVVLVPGAVLDLGDGITITVTAP
ncbi:FHA domain-containing protein [Nocardioides coralli]|uniref:FHA domain-containing protein n=1 Tax=Nocardioides coralli TaxID=2872154 RepID=UPI001CA411EF|nr:FHA domain-containing protein [Nocardioides coralli]QZY28663.1 FHA domain-containing protein [Nocardioides coralli]